MLDTRTFFNTNTQGSSLCDTLYEHKFVNRTFIQPTKRNQLIASQMKPLTSEGKRTASVSQIKRRPIKSSSVGSLQPKLNEIVGLQKLDRRQRLREGTLKKKIFAEAPPMSKLDIYFSSKHIDREQQNNILFLSNNIDHQQPHKPTHPPQLTDQDIQDRFAELVGVHENYCPEKNMRALLNLATKEQLTQEQKIHLLQKQKKKIESVAKEMLDDYHGDARHKDLQKIAGVGGGDQYSQSDLQELSSEGFLRTQGQINVIASSNNERGIGWVLKECKRYQKRFNVKLLTNNFAKKHKKKNP